jgi:hypothetical protein
MIFILEIMSLEIQDERMSVMEIISFISDFQDCLPGSWRIMYQQNNEF